MAAAAGKSTLFYAFTAFSYYLNEICSNMSKG